MDQISNTENSKSNSNKKIESIYIILNSYAVVKTQICEGRIIYKCVKL